MKLETATRLYDAAQACQEIQALTSDLPEDAFLDDRLRELAVWKLLELVGGAVRRAEQTDSSLRQSIPGIRDIIDIQNRISPHGYDSIDFGIVLEIAQNEVPTLRRQLEILLLDAPDISNGGTRDR